MEQGPPAQNRKEKDKEEKDGRKMRIFTLKNDIRLSKQDKEDVEKRIEELNEEIRKLKKDGGQDRINLANSDLTDLEMELVEINDWIKRDESELERLEPNPAPQSSGNIWSKIAGKMKKGGK